LSVIFLWGQINRCRGNLNTLLTQLLNIQLLLTRLSCCGMCTC